MQKRKHTRIGQTMSNERATNRKVSEVTMKNIPDDEIAAALA